jgi:hypothetical protein
MTVWCCAGQHTTRGQKQPHPNPQCSSGGPLNAMPHDAGVVTARFNGAEIAAPGSVAATTSKHRAQEEPTLATLGTNTYDAATASAAGVIVAAGWPVQRYSTSTNCRCHCRRYTFFRRRSLTFTTGLNAASPCSCLLCASGSAPPSATTRISLPCTLHPHSASS